MTQIPNKNSGYDLEERTLAFAKRTFQYVRRLPRTITNVETGRQLTRSSGSMGTNYIEGNEALGKRDFLMRIKICKKEAKETIYWLRLTESAPEFINEKDALIKEATELMKIFGSILEKSK